MGIFTRARATRDAFPYPDIPTNGSLGSYAGDFASTRPVDGESASRKVAIWAAQDLLASLTSLLPLSGVVGDGTDRRRVELPRFFDDPDGSGQGWEDWCSQLMWSWSARGNAFGRILARGADGKPSQIKLQHPDAVTVRTDPYSGLPVWRFGAKEVPTAEVWHRRMYPVPGRLLGASPIERHAVTIGQGLAAGAFGWRFFTDGGHPSAILKNTLNEKIDQPVAAGVKAKFLAAMRGTREPVVMGSGWEYQAIQVTPEESQFLDTQRYTAAECCRIYGPGIAEVLGYETGGSMTYANVEGRRLDLLTFSFDRWFSRLETVLTADVMPPGRELKLNRGKLLATDLTTRYASYRTGIEAGFLDEDEARALEDRPPLARDPDEELARRSEVVGVLVRAGFEPAAVMAALKLPQVAHTGLVPVTVTTEARSDASTHP